MTTQMSVAQGEFTLRRLPLRSNDVLQAWDAADEYLLNTLAEMTLPLHGSRVLLINDSFGALAVALADFKPVSWSDSNLAQKSMSMNLTANGFAVDAVEWLDSVHTPDSSFELILIKVPKTLALLEDFLLRLRPSLTTQTTIILAGMLKNLPPSVWTLLERIVGLTRSSLAKKKARLVFCDFDPNLQVSVNPYPTSYKLEHTEWVICNHSNVFSREQLDIGTRFFLAHLPESAPAKTIVDLGCGNGVLGIMAALKHPEATVTFVDESFMALASARQNFNTVFRGQRHAEFRIGDGLAEFEEASVELILCNPPFHQQQAIGDHLALRMFKQAYKTLETDGELWIIGNRHLGYSVSLKKIFGNSRLIAQNAKFVILQAKK